MINVLPVQKGLYHCIPANHHVLHVQEATTALMPQILHPALLELIIPMMEAMIFPPASLVLQGLTVIKLLHRLQALAYLAPMAHTAQILEALYAPPVDKDIMGKKLAQVQKIHVEFVQQDHLMIYPWLLHVTCAKLEHTATIQHLLLVLTAR